MPVNGETPAGDYEVVKVAVARPPQELPTGKWMTALTFSTDDLLKTRRSHPPAIQLIDYHRPARSLSVAPASGPRRGKPLVQGVLYVLDSKVPPLVTQTIEIADQVRCRLMGLHKKYAGGPELVSPRFSGKNPDGEPLHGHQHAYILPFSSKNDVRIDRMLVFCRNGFDDLEQKALDRLTSDTGLYQRGRDYEIRCVPVKWGKREDICGPKRNRFASITPFVPTRHFRQGRGEFADWLKEELRRECRNHDRPVPSQIRMVDRTAGPGRQFRWLEFRRNRKGDDSMMGYGFEIEFEEPQCGPIALGYGAHFGLGQFRPVE
jgi:CRISPR-associated protein Csb2